MSRADSWLAGLLVALLFAHPVHGGDLADALEQAWARNGQAGTLEAREAEAGARAELAAGLTPGPAELSLGHLDDRPGGDRGKREWELELATPLWLPGQKAAHGAEAASALDEVAARRAGLRLDLAGELRAAWWTLASARQADDLARRRLSTARSLEADVLRRHRAGDLSRVDANQARGETLAALAGSLEAEAAVGQAERAWRSLTGMAAPARLAAETLPGSLEPREDHPRLVALAGAARTARARLKVAQVTRRDAPALAVRVLRERGDATESYSNALGVRVTIPFSSGPRSRRDDAVALAEATRAESERMLAARRLALEVEQARVELDVAERQMVMARERRELTADTLRLAEKAFALGEADLAALLRARAAAFEAESLHARQESARGRAVSQLRQALGEMP
jgi:cobalt-zinc-cadmium efflux system outer membrane protein